MNIPTIIRLPNVVKHYQQPSVCKDGTIDIMAHDVFHMGQDFSKGTFLLFANHTTEPGKYLILVNKRTGEQVRVDFPENWQ